uniref:Uncharacterized protein n=1 Tax=Chenopodium quinoa TaxID=63459 RepID=A0A803NAR2_CHEQI
MKFSAILCSLNFLILFAIINSSNVTAQQESKNKFRERQATDDSAGYPNLDEDELLNTQCPRNLELRWQAEVSSSIYATPLIADINSDGKLDIVVPSFVHYLEVLEGSDGDKMPGWPAYHQSTVHASPLLYDIDKDGIREIALATYNGEVLFFRASGYLMSDKLIVPRRRVPKNWYEGLNPDPVDRSHPDVDDQQLIQEAAETNLVSHLNTTKMGSNVPEISSTGGHPVMINESMPHRDGKNDNQGNSYVDVPKTINVSLDSGSSLDVLNTSSLNEGKLNESQETINLLNTVTDSSENTGSNGTALLENGAISSSSPNELGDNMKTENRQNSRRRLLEDTAFKGAVGGSENVQTATVENDDALEAEADSSFELFRGSDELADEYSYDYDDYVDENMWGDEDWIESQHETVEDYVDIDSHILSTPVIADIDNDGILEMVVAVSYFFDRDYYDKPDNAKDLGGIDIGKYVAGGIVVFNLDTKQVKWTANLDLSTDSTKFRAYIYSSPTVVDLDNDGNLDILVGTSFGLFYVLDHHGKIFVLLYLCMVFCVSTYA